VTDTKHVQQTLDGGAATIFRNR